MQQGIAFAHAHGGQRLGPEIAHFEDKRDALPTSQPPTGKADQQLRGGCNYNVRPLEEKTCACRRYAKRAVVQHSLVRFSIRKRKQPSADDIYAVGLLVRDQSPELVAILGRHDAGRMIGKPGEHSYFVPCRGPMPGQFGRARGRRTHLRRKVLRDVKNLH